MILHNAEESHSQNAAHTTHQFAGLGFPPFMQSQCRDQMLHGVFTRLGFLANTVFNEHSITRNLSVSCNFQLSVEVTTLRICSSHRGCSSPSCNEQSKPCSKRRKHSIFGPFHSSAQVSGRENNTYMNAHRLGEEKRTQRQTDNG